MAEWLAYDVINDFEETLKPVGCILILSGRHLCKEMRGVKKWNSPFEVIEARGVLLSNKTGSKDEFMARIGARV
jgi:GTP cyclohydrolase I